jgi:hypothetical protein
MQGGRTDIAGEYRTEAEDKRARAAWLLAVDVADEAFKAGFLKVYDMPAKRGRGSPEALAMPRRVALYLATNLGNVPARPLAKAAGVHHSTVTHHVGRVHDLRDERPGFNVLIEDMERRLMFTVASLVFASLEGDRKAVEGLA